MRLFAVHAKTKRNDDATHCTVQCAAVSQQSVSAPARVYWSSAEIDTRGPFELLRLNIV